jgi:hypothetical protein
MRPIDKDVQYLRAIADAFPKPRKTEEQEEEGCDDPALDPDNDYCSCGRLTDNYPVICDHCKYMARIP